MSDYQLLRITEVSKLVGLGKTSIYALLSKNRFPQPLRVAPGSVRWRRSDIEAWIDKLAAEAAWHEHEVQSLE